MFIILGLVLLVAAVVVGVTGVVTNHGSAHVLTHRFAIFGYHVNGSTGRLFLYGLIVGAVGVLGLGLLLTGARRTSRRASAARQGLKQSRGETAAVAADRDDAIDQRDDLIHEREAARAKTVNAPSNVSSDGDGDGYGSSDAGRRSLLHPLGHGAAPAPVATAEPQIVEQPTTS